MGVESSGNVGLPQDLRSPFFLLVRAAITVLLSLGAAAAIAPASAQEVRWNLVDTGVATHSDHGTGIEMRIVPEPALSGADFDMASDLTRQLCRFYAPYVVPHLEEQMGLKDADFIAVRIASGGRFLGRYVYARFEFVDDGCGEPLTAE